MESEESKIISELRKERDAIWDEVIKWRRRYSKLAAQSDKELVEQIEKEIQ